MRQQQRPLDGDLHFPKQDQAWPVAVYRTSLVQQFNRVLGIVQDDDRFSERMHIDHIAYMNVKPNL
jgi:hypothetical protein